jgi:Prokaryotic homologs of the JAB domain
MRPRPENQSQVVASIAPSRYQCNGMRLVLPDALPQAVTDAFSGSAQRGEEAGALLYGTRGSSPGHPDVVRAVLIPDQVGNRTHYRVPYDAIAAASAVTRSNGLVTLAQVHTHPGDDVEHSWYDDLHAISTRAISIVLPRYGRTIDNWLEYAGIHEYKDAWWHLLTADQAAQRVSFAAAPLQVIDLRLENPGGLDD